MVWANRFNGNLVRESRPPHYFFLNRMSARRPSPKVYIDEPGRRFHGTRLVGLQEGSGGTGERIGAHQGTRATERAGYTETKAHRGPKTTLATRGAEAKAYRNPKTTLATRGTETKAHRGPKTTLTTRDAEAKADCSTKTAPT